MNPHPVPRGPDRTPLSIADLPPTYGRMTIRHKRWIVAAVQSGVIALDAAMKRYRLSLDEFLAWQRGHVHANRKAVRS